MAKKWLESDDNDDNQESEIEPLGNRLDGQHISDISDTVARLRGLLHENPEDQEIYKTIRNLWGLRAELRPGIHDLFQEEAKKGSKTAAKFLQSFPKDVSRLLADADDAYYAAEYDRAIQLYRQILTFDPGHVRAKTYLAKAEIEQGTGKTETSLPRSAIQFYRRALPFIADREFLTAEYLLKTAIEAARAEEKDFPEAEEALTNLVNSIRAIEYRRNANYAINNKDWSSASEYLRAAQALDPALSDADEKMIREIELKAHVPAHVSFLRRILNRLAGDTTTDAPPPEKKKKTKGK